MSPCTEMAPEARSPLLGLIGRTPLLRLCRFERAYRDVQLYAKAEWHNPGGSVKDRAAARMVLDGIREGRLDSGRRILDATSGNTGIAYAMIGAALGYGVTLCLPANVSPERRRILRAYEAELVLTDPLEGSDGAIREARRLFAADPKRYFYPDQYNNEGNWRAHYETTGPEIFEQTGGRITHFVAGLGTGGTFVGAGRRLRELGREQQRHVTLVSVQPDSPFHGLEGLKHMESAIVPGIYDPRLADLDVRVATEEAYAMVKRLAAEEGLLVGVSSGAALAAALRVAETSGPAVMAMVFCDDASKYLSERFWDDGPGDDIAATAAGAGLT